MTELYNYKLWNPNLNQFVAQPDKQTADHIHSLGGVILLDGGHPMSSMRPQFEDLAATTVASRVDELAAH